MDAHLHTGHSLSWTVTKVCARAQEQVKHEKVQDEMAERWVMRLGQDDGASQGRRHPEKGVTSVGGRRRLGCSEGLNKPESVEGAAGRKWLNTWEGSEFPTGARGQEFGFHSGWVVWEMVGELKSR